ncbi:type III pantothenate kinase [Pseudoalteromonas espejiana DSM 9414]|uniref:Type III pantothenate kinase n=1 Tax=Pseudoalteromonas espejiana TaxID=28107 RepID=A0A510XTN2_9GAMM|nr:type III pantothenate kinase [Pseudoalteromonas espejiana]ASM51495.1 type III pantothenate kinase [Pseudoalteromonas espejiana DSM 9414]GEK54398.1 type III pantothenate kinase [Pseudoalteromonas espejiana]
MKLLIDVGNTSLKAALWHNQQIQPTDLSELPWQSVTEVVYACVGKSEQLNSVLAVASQKSIPCFEASVTKQLGAITCAYEQVSNLGIDRWLAIIAAYTLYPNTPCIVVDAGTATTIDVLSAKGEHLGGWILPGLDLMTRSLTQNTQRVFDDANTPFLNELGKNTPNGLKNGALVATLGAIEQAKIHLNQVTGSHNPQIICAGGYGLLLQQQISGSIFDSLLVMKGLNYWHELSKNDEKL